MWWPFDRRRPPTAAGSPVPVEEGWAHVPPLDLAAAEAPVVADVDDFVAGLATRRPAPLALAPLEHQVTLAGPAGTIVAPPLTASAARIARREASRTVTRAVARP